MAEQNSKFGIERLNSYLNQTEFTVKGRLFYMPYRLDSPYKVEEKEIDIHFIKSKMVGFLRGKNSIAIYHTGFFPEDDFPRLCEYNLIKEDSSKDPEVIEVDHIKILLQNVVFEDHCHKGFGVIINDF